LREKQKEKEMNNEISHSILNTNYPDIFIFKLQNSFLLLHHKKKKKKKRIQLKANSTSTILIKSKLKLVIIVTFKFIIKSISYF
jgi:hypothetical protein